MRDALRRVIVNKDLSPEDINALCQLCLNEGVKNDSSLLSLKAEPLTADHVPSDASSNCSVKLLSLGNLIGVNRLPSDQTLKFGAIGLTIVYGDNGTGKSGYARVIKKACRCRGAPPVIKPNAFSPGQTTNASAVLIIAKDDKEETINWDINRPGSPILGNVIVFDQTTAKHYVEEEGAATLTPYGLDILPKLSKIFDGIGALIQEKILELQAEINACKDGLGCYPNTTVGAQLISLSHSSDPKYFEKISKLSDEEVARRNELLIALSPNSTNRSAETKASAKRLRDLVKEIKNAEIALSDKSLERVNALIERRNAAIKLSKELGDKYRSDEFLPGTGNENWRLMVNAAQHYSKTVDDSDGSLHAKGKCLLCQDLADEPTRDRLSSFLSFCNNPTQALLDLESSKLVEEKQQLAQLNSLSICAKNAESDLLSLTESDQNALANYLRAIDVRLTIAGEAIDSIKTRQFDPLPRPPIDGLESCAGDLDRRAILEDSASKKDERIALEKELAELDARLKIREQLNAIEAQIKRYKTLNLLNLRKTATSTRSITDKSSELSRELVTVAFCEAFKSEISKIGRSNLKVSIQDAKGKKGEVRFALKFDDASDCKINEVASEGEQRCIALAAFFAELSQSSNKSALVFDDPVTSLDGMHHAKVAHRLAEEAAVRQVIVFTHNSSFWIDLHLAATELKIETKTLYLEWEKNTPGYCREKVPWMWTSAKDSLDQLEKMQRQIAAMWNDIPSSQNTSDMLRAYSLLRATIENMLERDALGGIILRRRDYIDTKHIPRLAGITESECSEYVRLIKICHNYVDAHGAPIGRHVGTRTPIDLLTDIQSARNLHQLGAARKQSSSD